MSSPALYTGLLGVAVAGAGLIWLCWQAAQSEYVEVVWDGR